MRRWLHLGLALLLAVSLAAQERAAKRLILKDGSYQLATKWELKGARVRYYSAERYMWEELPKDLVDWEATEKWEKEKGGRTRELQQLSAEEEEERRRELEKTPEVAPGLRLPREEGVFLLDPYQGEVALVELVQEGGEINAERGKNMLRAAINPFGSMKQSIELKGTKARVQAHSTQPVFFVNVPFDPSVADEEGGPKSADAPGRYRIVRVRVRKDARVVGNLKIKFTGKVTQEGNWVPAREQPVSGGWVKVTPEQPLPPGEYALVEMLGPREMNLYVWDFGVDPSAPRNASAWKPVAAPSTETGTQETPILNKRK